MYVRDSGTFWTTIDAITGKIELWGSGLGLSLVKTIVENHHGQIDVTSSGGQGTTITVTQTHCDIRHCSASRIYAYIIDVQYHRRAKAKTPLVNSLLLWMVNTK